MRDPNAIDFWRGFALVTIFVNHIPGNTFVRYTFSQYGISDAAELFVFLAGWSIGIATRRRDGTPEPAGQSVVRLLARTVEVYRAQLSVMLLALALIAG
ncbi:OpgC domain-containing protein, partial [Methylobacterium brachiatum]